MKEITQEMLIQVALDLATTMGWHESAVEKDLRTGWRQGDPVPGFGCAFAEHLPEKMETDFVCDIPSIYVSESGPDIVVSMVFRKTPDDGFTIRMYGGKLYKASTFGDMESVQTEFMQTLANIFSRIEQRTT